MNMASNRLNLRGEVNITSIFNLYPKLLRAVDDYVTKNNITINNVETDYTGTITKLKNVDSTQLGNLINKLKTKASGVISLEDNYRFMKDEDRLELTSVTAFKYLSELREFMNRFGVLGFRRDETNHWEIILDADGNIAQPFGPIVEQLTVISSMTGKQGFTVATLKGEVIKGLDVFPYHISFPSCHIPYTNCEVDTHCLWCMDTRGHLLAYSVLNANTIYTSLNGEKLFVSKMTQNTIFDNIRIDLTHYEVKPSQPLWVTHDQTILLEYYKFTEKGIGKTRVPTNMEAFNAIFNYQGTMECNYVPLFYRWMGIWLNVEFLSRRGRLTTIVATRNPYVDLLPNWLNGDIQVWGYNDYLVADNFNIGGYELHHFLDVALVRIYAEVNPLVVYLLFSEWNWNPFRVDGVELDLPFPIVSVPCPKVVFHNEEVVLGRNSIGIYQASGMYNLSNVLTVGNVLSFMLNFVKDSNLESQWAQAYRYYIQDQYLCCSPWTRKLGIPSYTAHFHHFFELGFKVPDSFEYGRRALDLVTQREDQVEFILANMRTLLPNIIDVMLDKILFIFIHQVPFIIKNNDHNISCEDILHQIIKGLLPHGWADMLYLMNNVAKLEDVDLSMMDNLVPDVSLEQILYDHVNSRLNNNDLLYNFAAFEILNDSPNLFLPLLLVSYEFRKVVLSYGNKNKMFESLGFLSSVASVLKGRDTTHVIGVTWVEVLVCELIIVLSNGTDILDHSSIECLTQLYTTDLNMVCLDDQYASVLRMYTSSSQKDNFAPQKLFSDVTLARISSSVDGVKNSESKSVLQMISKLRNQQSSEKEVPVGMSKTLIPSYRSGGFRTRREYYRGTPKDTRVNLEGEVAVSGILQKKFHKISQYLKSHGLNFNYSQYSFSKAHANTAGSREIVTFIKPLRVGREFVESAKVGFANNFDFLRDFKADVVRHNIKDIEDMHDPKSYKATEVVEVGDSIDTEIAKYSALATFALENKIPIVVVNKDNLGCKPEYLICPDIHTKCMYKHAIKLLSNASTYKITFRSVIGLLTALVNKTLFKDLKKIKLNNMADFEWNYDSVNHFVAEGYEYKLSYKDLLAQILFQIAHNLHINLIIAFGAPNHTFEVSYNISIDQAAVYLVVISKDVRFYLLSHDIACSWAHIVQTLEEEHVRFIYNNGDVISAGEKIVNHTVMWNKLDAATAKYVDKARLAANVSHYTDQGQCFGICKIILERGCYSEFHNNFVQVMQFYKSMLKIAPNSDQLLYLNMPFSMFLILLLNVMEVRIVCDVKASKYKDCNLFFVLSGRAIPIPNVGFKSIVFSDNPVYYETTDYVDSDVTPTQIEQSFSAMCTDLYTFPVTQNNKIALIEWCGNIKLLPSMRFNNLIYKLSLINIIQIVSRNNKKGLYTGLLEGFGLLVHSVSAEKLRRHTTTYLSVYLEQINMNSGIKNNTKSKVILPPRVYKDDYAKVDTFSESKVRNLITILEENPLDSFVNSLEFNEKYKAANSESDDPIMNYFNTIISMYTDSYIIDDVDREVKISDKSHYQGSSYPKTENNKHISVLKTSVVSKGKSRRIKAKKSIMQDNVLNEALKVLEITWRLSYENPKLVVVYLNSDDCQALDIKCSISEGILLCVDYETQIMLIFPHDQVNEVRLVGSVIAERVYVDLGIVLGLVDNKVKSLPNIQYWCPCTINKLSLVLRYCATYSTRFDNIWKHLISDINSQGVIRDSQVPISDVMSNNNSTFDDNGDHSLSVVREDVNGDFVTFSLLQKYHPYDIYSREDVDLKINSKDFIDYFVCSDEVVRSLDSKFPRGRDEKKPRAITTLSGLITDIRHGLILEVTDLEREFINYMVNYHNDEVSKNSWLVSIILFVLLTADQNWTLNILIPCGILSVKYSEWNSYWSTFHNTVRNIWADPSSYNLGQDHIVDVLLNANINKETMVHVSSLCYIYTFVGRPNQEVDWDEEGLKRLRNIDSFHFPVRKNITYPFTSLQREADRVLAMCESDYIKYILGDKSTLNYQVVYHNNYNDTWEDCEGSVVDRNSNGFIVEVYGNSTIQDGDMVYLLHNGRCFRLHNFAVPKINKFVWNPDDSQSMVNFEVFKKVMNTRRVHKTESNFNGKYDENTNIGIGSLPLGSLGVRPYVSNTSIAATMSTINRYRKWINNPTYRKMFNREKSISTLFRELDIILCGIDYVTFYKLISPILGKDRYVRLNSEMVNEAMQLMLYRQFKFKPCSEYTYKDHITQAQLWVVNGSASGENDPWDSEDIKVIKRAAEKQLSTHFSTTRTQTAENYSLEEQMCRFWDEHDIPHIAKSHTKGNEHGKLRSIFNSTMTNYTLGSYFAKVIGDGLISKEMTLNKSGLDSIEVMNSLTDGSNKNLPCISLDYSDFNAQHPLAFQADIVYALKNAYLKHYLNTSMYDDVARCADHVANSFLNQVFIVDYELYKEGHPKEQSEQYKYQTVLIGNRKYCAYQVNSGLFSGTRLTTLLNTLFNMLYSFMVCEISKCHDIDCTPVIQQFLGDDSIMYFKSCDSRDAYMSFFFFSGLDLNSAKQLRGVGRGEYLRILEDPSGIAVGNMNRALATIVHGNVESKERSSGTAACTALHSQVALLDRRHGRVDRIAPWMLHTCSRTVWFYPQCRLIDVQMFLYLPSEFGGLGLNPVGISGDIHSDRFDTYKVLDIRDSAKEFNVKSRYEFGDCMQKISEYFTVSDAVKTILTQNPQSPFYGQPKDAVTVAAYLDYVKRTLSPYLAKYSHMWESKALSSSDASRLQMMKQDILNTLRQDNVLGISYNYATNKILNTIVRREGNTNSNFLIFSETYTNLLSDLFHGNLTDNDSVDIDDVDILKKIDSSEELSAITESLLRLDTDLLKAHFKSTTLLVEYLKSRWNLDLNTIREKKVLVRLLRNQLESGTPSVKEQRRIDGQKWLRYIILLRNHGCIDDDLAFYYEDSTRKIDYNKWTIKSSSNGDKAYLKAISIEEFMVDSYHQYSRSRKLWIDNRKVANYVQASLLFKENDSIKRYLQSEFNVSSFSKFAENVDIVGKSLGGLEASEFNTNKIMDIENRSRGLLGVLVNVWDLLNRDEREKSLRSVSHSLNCDVHTIKRVLSTKYMRSVRNYSRGVLGYSADMLSLIWLSSLIVPECQKLYRYYIGCVRDMNGIDYKNLIEKFSALMFLQY